MSKTRTELNSISICAAKERREAERRAELVDCERRNRIEREEMVDVKPVRLLQLEDTSWQPDSQKESALWLHGAARETGDEALDYLPPPSI